MMPSKAFFSPQLYDITNLANFFKKLTKALNKFALQKTHCICLIFSQFFGQNKRKFCAKIH